MTAPPPWAEDAHAALERLGADPAQGLTTAQAEARLAEHGANVLRSVERVSLRRL